MGAVWGAPLGDATGVPEPAKQRGMSPHSGATARAMNSARERGVDAVRVESTHREGRLAAHQSFGELKRNLFRS